jgi:hypothetical protein
MKFPFDAATGSPLTQADALAFTKNNGLSDSVKPPRNLQYQAGSRKALVTWDAPEDVTGVIGYRIYTSNENSLLDTISDPNVRQYNVPCSAGSSPPVKNVFISAFSKQRESAKPQIQVKALAEAGAPTDPIPPPGSAASGDTGGFIGVDGGSDAGFIRGH